MGTIEVNGYAIRKVHYDAMEIKISFISDANTSEKASKQVMEQCELFLEKIEEIGIDIDKIQIADDVVRKSSYRDDYHFSAEREILMKTKFDMKFVNVIRDILHTLKAETEISTNYILLEKDQIHAELLREALLDSQKKAKDIAETLGLEVIKLVSADKNGRRGYDSGMKCLQEDVVACPSIQIPDFLRMNKLQSREIIEMEDIIVVWEIG